MNFTIQVPAPEDRGHSFTVTANVAVSTPQELQAAASYLRSREFKLDFQEWLDKNFTGFGFALGSHAFPVFETEGDRTTPVKAYATEIRLTRPF